MSRKFFLPCTCGSTTPVDARLAGETISCKHCKNILDVPKLRDLQKLAAVEESRIQTVAGWSELQGVLFAAGLLALALAICCSLYTWSFRRTLDTTRPDFSQIEFSYDLTTIPLSESWSLWKDFKDAKIDVRRTPYYIGAREKVKEYDRWLTAFAVVGGAGLISILSSFFVGRRSA